MSQEATPSRDLYEAYWSQASPPPFSDPLTPRRRELLWRLLGEYGIPPARLLDCGAGDGGLVADADARGLQATGLELAQATIARAGAAHPGIELIRHSIEDRPWPVPPDSFDCVVAFEVIEHIRFFTDRALRRILEETGFVVERVVHLGRVWGLWANTFTWARRV